MNETEKRIHENAALAAHRGLGARHYAAYDFIMTDDGPCLLEVDTLPELTEMSMFSKALAACNLSMPEFLDYVIGLALQKK
jgi:D-alanine-D-alanine ligase